MDSLGADAQVKVPIEVVKVHNHCYSIRFNIKEHATNTRDPSDMVFTLASEGLILDSASSNVELVFRKRDYHIRRALPLDYEALLKLEKLCWDPDLQVSSSEIKSRISTGESLVATFRDEVVAVVYAQRTCLSPDLSEVNYQNISRIMDKAGQAVQLLSLNVLPEYSNLIIGTTPKSEDRVYFRPHFEDVFSDFDKNLTWGDQANFCYHSLPRLL